MVDILDTQFEGADIKLTSNRVQLGDDLNLLEKDPALKDIMVCVGWDSKAFGLEAVDVDVSLFLLGNDGLTRDNDDFVYYNNMEACDGSVRHEGDNRIGAGEGDDETILLNLHGIPFDVSRIVFVYSIYKGGEKDQGLGLVKNSYIRLVNAKNNHEILRFDLDQHFVGLSDTGSVVGSINREGPKWHFTPLMDIHSQGLTSIATQYGMNVISQ